MEQTASDYLQALQQHEELYHWIAAFMPRDGGGSNLTDMPAWFHAQVKAQGLAPESTFIDTFVKMLRSVDLARMNFESLVEKLPSEISTKLRIGDRLAVGTLNSCEFNGAVLSVPDSDGRSCVVAFPFGGMFLPIACSDLLQIALRDLMVAIFIDAFYDANGYRQSFMDRARRVSQIASTRPGIQRKYTTDVVANHLQIQLHRYATLGIFDTHDFCKEWLPIPVFGDKRRFGHPLEPGAAIGEFARRFLILHECGHIILGTTTANCISHQAEFDADEFSLKWSLAIASTTGMKLASAIGAFVFLEIAHWIDRLTDEPRLKSTHPPPPDRMKYLEAVIAKTENLSRSERRLVEHGVQEVRDRFAELWAKSAALRSWQANGKSSLVTTILSALEEEKPDIFLDQVPRWLMFGASEKLCNELGKLRSQLEKRTINLNGKEDAALNLVLRLYAMADSNASSNLFDHLERAYRNHKNRMDKEGTP